MITNNSSVPGKTVGNAIDYINQLDTGTKQLKNVYDLRDKVEKWAEDRNLIEGATTHAQMLKLMEEMGELAAGIAKSNDALIEDSLGDCMVVLIILSAQLNKDLFGCLDLAYNEIKDRKGRMIDGVFVKESDL
jgi:NTP pyrophosphatase (non-canonical NTP hydrolase)